MRLSFIIPTRNRHAELAHTLAILGSLDPRILGDDPELIIADNASDEPLHAPRALASGIRVTIIRLHHNAAAAARNTAAHHATGDWLVMLDDDSAPTGGDFVSVLADAPADLAALGGEIFLPDGTREAGGLPEVIIGCGAAIRRDAFLAVRGYDPAFDYYAEEYDLGAKLITRGNRIAHTRAFAFEHRKVNHGRDFNRIIARLVRNNGWTIARHAPEALRAEELRAMTERYRAIAVRERAERGYNEGLDELQRTIDAQPRTPLSQPHWDRFTGIAACRDHLPAQLRAARARTAALTSRGKGDTLIEQVIRESGLTLLPDDVPADALVIGTLSPGPMLDAATRHQGILAPWNHDSALIATQTI